MYKRSIAILLLIVFIPLAVGGCASPTSSISKDGYPKLVRIEQKGILGGVSAGLAYYFGWDVTLVRVLWVVAVVFFGTGILFYLILWAVMPPATSVPPNFEERTGG